MYLCNFERTIAGGAEALLVVNSSKSGGNGIKATLVPIPNTKVKLYSADVTAGAALWESRTSPDNS